MNTKLIQSRFLSLPIWDMPEKVETYIALLLLADPSGEVEHAIDALSLQTGIQRAVLSYVIDRLEDQGFIKKSEGSVFLLEHPCFTMDTQSEKKKNKVSSTKRNELGISERISIFTSSLQQEVQKWEARTQQFFPPEQVREFLEYWTEHGEKDRKFRQENCDKWDWQRRLTTWYKRIQKNTAQDELRTRYMEERERRQKAIEKMIETNEKAKDGYTEYLRELRLAANGDEAMRKKIPQWETLSRRHLPKS